MSCSQSMIKTRASSSFISVLVLVLVLSSTWCCCHASTVALTGSIGVVHKIQPTYSNSRRRVPFTTFHEWGTTSAELPRQQDEVDYDKVVDCSVRGCGDSGRVGTPEHLDIFSYFPTTLSSLGSLIDRLQYFARILFEDCLGLVRWYTTGNNQVSNNCHQRVRGN
jgi:hypothetical protein